MEMNAQEMRFSRQASPVKIMIHQKQLKNDEYFNYLDKLVTNDARCTHDVKSRTGIIKAAFNN
jgi:hypothetical protein